MANQKSPKMQFGSSQEEFFTIARAILASVLRYLAIFFQNKAKYTEAYVNSILADIAAAEDMPQLAARTEDGKIMREETAKLLNEALALWKVLETYIMDAYPKSERTTRLEAAGAKQYARAKQQSWNHAKSLLSAGKKFIAENTAALEANENMPKSFPEKYNNAEMAFTAMYEKYAAEKERQTVDTSDRNNAIAKIFETIQGVCRDGQAYFEGSPEKQELFVFEKAKKGVLGTKPGGINGTVVNEAGKVIVGATVHIEGLDKALVTDKKGRFAWKQLAAGKYGVTCSAAEYETAEVQQVVNAGIVGRCKVVMKLVK